MNPSQTQTHSLDQLLHNLVSVLPMCKNRRERGSQLRVQSTSIIVFKSMQVGVHLKKIGMWFTNKAEVFNQ